MPEQVQPETTPPPPPADSGCALRLEGVTKTYLMGEVEVPVLRGVDAEIPRGRISVVLGASGSGKSTLLNMIGGVDRPTAGRIWFDKEEITGYSEAALTLYRRENVGFVFQFYNLIPTLTAAENVDVVADLVRDPIPSLKALDLVDLRDRAGHFPAQLSGGQQQRVSIARALAKQPRLLLCDEPTGALDRETGVKVLSLIQDLNRKFSTTTVMITHAPAIAELAHCVFHLQDGKIVKVDRRDSPKEADRLQW